MKHFIAKSDAHKMHLVRSNAFKSNVTESRSDARFLDTHRNMIIVTEQLCDLKIVMEASA